MRWFLLILLALAPGLASAWPLNGLPLTGAPDDQAAPMIASDGSGGAFVAWQDYRVYGSGGVGSLGIEYYLQRATLAGQIAPGWPVDGLAVGTGAGHQFPGAMLADGAGGVLIVYGDTRVDSGDLYLQRITGSGAIAPGWPVGGVPVAVAPGEQTAAELTEDGGGGAFVSWQDGLDAANTSARYTHILGDGQRAPGWPAEGRLFEPTAQFVLRPLMLATEDGGFLACWPISDDTLKSATLLAQRFTSDGTAHPGWPAGGVTACERLPFHRVPRVRLASDAAGGFFTIFADGRASGIMAEDLYAQHVLGSGAIAPGWPADGLPVSALPGVDETDPDLCEDGQGGVFFAWEDYRSGAARVFGQHLAGDGQRHAGWPALGLSLTDRPGFQLSPKLAWDGVRSAYVTWNSLESTGYRSYVQHLTAGGMPFMGWPPSGLPVIPLATDQYVPVITADGLGGAIVAWEDIREAERDLYAQRFVADGVVAAQVSLASAEADAGEVRIRWRVSGETQAKVERREGEGPWRVLVELTADGAGQLSLVDRDVRPGARYDYRLAFASGTRGGEVSLVVPEQFVLALEGARPNPASGPLWVAFTLPGASSARLELYDLSGRRLASREVGEHGVGRHVVRLDEGALAPGLYWASLTYGGRTLRGRFAVVR